MAVDGFHRRGLRRSRKDAALGGSRSTLFALLLVSHPRLPSACPRFVAAHGSCTSAINPVRTKVNKDHLRIKIRTSIQAILLPILGQFLKIKSVSDGGRLLRGSRRPYMLPVLVLGFDGALKGLRWGLQFWRFRQQKSQGKNPRCSAQQMHAEKPKASMPRPF